MSAKDTAPHAEPEVNGGSSKSSTPQSKSGWDGKLRVNKQATLANPEALSDPDYSDDDAPPVDQIEADEGTLAERTPCRVLWEIDVQHSRVSTIPALHLERFKRLRRLCLRQNSIQRIELPTELASTLEELELYDNLVKHIDGLQDFTQMQILDLSYNKLKHIKNLAHLTKLHHLYFVQNRLSNIENLETLTELVYLELGANRIREIQCLETLTKLEHLWLGQNRITELKGLNTLTHLRTLSIQANRLTSLSGLEALPQLTELYVSNNRITSLEPLRSNPKLEILDFQTNPISSLAGLEDLEALENLWASNCEIEDFREIERALRDKEKLEEVYFEGNPVQKQGPVLYRNKIRLTLPQVLKIDAVFATFIPVTMAYIKNM
ncbi:protein phosphatase regulatory subunit Sds22 [Friedmanniomyces endolithicus]|uniref:Protein phosphatase regulatory subunit Sds22 n=1 Tax=Friedmanniomyces endolithicus TaxID=329885 RepID=A0AAN6KNH6_9PEZI|nr:protein phosphatase regulatory subunit Sds22 [Friedmanniomyces endolithicus]KAK0287874.1 protein phosphatase regulatory subunit Sds22 [Friedmanniomyces endolithicus]KAK0310464.1 protein phosphatase regulatory subunit Sds22 [Friedmanniomyces endolithicus]KAK0320792.1 protein phosphatase regulatory subunit Sds22 [Friedmanniomyces endolithicus]KAK0828041.1 protein phosphatase regulatory subunit Sds22 [Friedmanniomyces endolithicus]